MRKILLDKTSVPAKERYFQIPWIYDAYAYNMDNTLPDITINVTKDDWKTALGNPEEIESLYIKADLVPQDYEIIGQMKNLKALYIYTARQLKDISFISNLLRLKELMISYSCIEDVTPIAQLRRKQNEYSPWNRLMQLAILKSEIRDLSPFKGDTRFSEFQLVQSNVSEEDALYKELYPYNR